LYVAVAWGGRSPTVDIWYDLMQAYMLMLRCVHYRINKREWLAESMTDTQRDRWLHVDSAEALSIYGGLDGCGWEFLRAHDTKEGRRRGHPSELLAPRQLMRTDED